MAVKISPQVRKVLAKVLPARTSIPNPQPSSKDPTKSLLMALWALPARGLQEDLLMVRRRDGRSYEVVDYNPITKEIRLVQPGKGSSFEFLTKLTEKIEETYRPVWAKRKQP